MVNDNLENALREIAEDSWEKYAQPALLSNIPEKLKERLQGDYKQLLESKSLKNFIQEGSSAKGYRLVEHPTQRAKIGIVPDYAVFEFPGEVGATPLEDLSRQDIDGFKRVLCLLTPDELQKLSLPASLVVKLLSIK